MALRCVAVCVLWPCAACAQPVSCLDRTRFNLFALFCFLEVDAGVAADAWTQTWGKTLESVGTKQWHAVSLDARALCKTTDPLRCNAMCAGNTAIPRMRARPKLRSNAGER
eukprot:827746-Rhodomonas_salina.2